MELKIVNQSNNALPAYETKNSAGMDLRAYLPDGPITLEPMQRGLVPTGLYMEIPEGYEGQVRPRSGLAIKSGDRIAQLIIAKCEQVEPVQVETLSETERGAGGFGHTGKK